MLHGVVGERGAVAQCLHKQVAGEPAAGVELLLFWKIFFLGCLLAFELKFGERYREHQQGMI